MTEDIYRALQQRLDTYSLGCPATESGVELLILKKLFSREDAELFLGMSPMVEEPVAVAGRLGRPVDAVASQMEDMARRGLLFRLRKGDSVKYGAVPLMHGIFEYQLKRLDREMGELMEQYYAQGLHRSIAGVNGLFLRVVPIEKSIAVGHHVAAFDDARAIIMKNETIAVAECICRKEKKIVGKGCGKPMETCFMFGSMAKYYIDNNLGRRVSADEAVDILRKAQDAGLVTQPGTAQNPAGMCSCCGDCCGVLLAIKSHPKPASIVFSNHRAAVNGDACSGCEACLDRCQMDAIVMDGDGIARVDPDRCIGCGLCVTTCPAGALALVPKPEPARQVPPATSAEQMMRIARNRGVI